MVSRKLSQRTNARLNRVDFFYTYSWVNGLCFGYFQIFPKRSPFDLKITLTLTPFPYVRRLLDLRVLTNTACLKRIKRFSTYILLFSIVLVATIRVEPLVLVFFCVYLEIG